MTYSYHFTISDILFEVHSPRPLAAESHLLPFMDRREGRVHLGIYISWAFGDAPKIRTEPLGADRVQTYYRQDGQNLCALREAEKGWLSICTCGDSYREFHCYINEAPFLSTPRSLGFVLRMLPLRAILQHHGVSFFHASQIALGHTGILFTAPSGTGKTTQARLWQKYRGARIVCNDRVLVKDGCTAGFPLDGSEPIGSTEENRLGAIVALRQGPDDQVRRLGPAKALQRLMPLLVIDGWDPQARQTAAGQLLQLIGTVPVYDLVCTPQEAAVACLEKQLKKDGVIRWE